MPLTSETRGMIDAAVFDAIRPGALIVNVGRGGSVDGKAMRAALAGGRIGGAILDVYEEEPLPPDDPLWSLPNVLLSPHMSAISDVRDARTVDILVDHVARYLGKEPLDNLVDINSRY